MRFVLKLYRPAVILLLLFGSLIAALLLPPGFIAGLFYALVSHRSVVLLVLLFGLLVLSLLWTAGHTIDMAGFMWFNSRGKRPEWLDGFMWGLTQLGGGLVTIVMAVVFFFNHQRRLSYTLLLGMITLTLTVETIKTLTERNRPYIKILDSRVIGAKARGLSFPSGHTAQSFFLSTLFVHYFNMGLAGAIILFGLAITVGVTRMYVGAHYPRDVLGGAVLGLLWGIVTGLLIT
jgi:membrane-associated phospholipid phosphatase